MMQVVITIKDKDKDLIPMFISNLKSELGEFTQDYTRQCVNDLRQGMSNERLIWRNELFSKTRDTRVNRYKSIVTMPEHGVMVDSMSPHYVKLKKGRLIRQWAYDKGNDRIRSIADREGSIYVKPHPFIESSLSNSEQVLGQLIENRIEIAASKTQK